MKKTLSILLALCLLSGMTACGPEADAPAQTAETGTAGASADAAAPTENESASSVLTQASPEAEAAAAEQTAHYPVTVTDQAGRQVTIGQEPETLVSGYYISTSLLIALGLDDRLVGLEAKADKRPIYSLSAPALLELPNVGSAKEFDLEGCAALEPDLVLLPLKLKQTARALEELGITVLYVNPENQALLEEMIGLIAAATDTQEEAQALLDFTGDVQAELKQRLEGTEKPSVYLAGNSSLLSTAGNCMYQADLIRLAGGVNAADGITDSYWAKIDYEQLLAWDPAYIILASDASYSVEDVLADENLASCRAVADGQVYRMPGSAEAWDSPVPGGILGAVWLAHILHPEQISEQDCESVIDRYYETFYDFTYSEN